MRDDAGTSTKGFTGNYADLGAGRADQWKIGLSVVNKARLRLFALRRQRHPCLNAMHAPAFRARSFKTFRMRNAPARNHPVHFARPDRLLHAYGVTVYDFACEQISNSCEPDMRMWQNIGLKSG